MPKDSKQEDSAMKNGQDLLDQRTFYFNEKDFDAFNKSLITENRINKKFEKLLSTSDHWDNY